MATIKIPKYKFRPAEPQLGSFGLDSNKWNGSMLQVTTLIKMLGEGVSGFFGGNIFISVLTGIMELKTQPTYSGSIVIGEQWSVF